MQAHALRFTEAIYVPERLQTVACNGSLDLRSRWSEAVLSGRGVRVDTSTDVTNGSRRDAIIRRPREESRARRYLDHQYWDGFATHALVVTTFSPHRTPRTPTVTSDLGNETDSVLGGEGSHAVPQQEERLPGILFLGDAAQPHHVLHQRIKAAVSEVSEMCGIERAAAVPAVIVSVHSQAG
jgi:hypothetical protein